MKFAVELPSTADQWAAQRRSRKQTAEEEAEFERWLRADPANAAEYEVAATFARLPGFLRHFSPHIAVQAFDEALNPPSRSGGNDHALVNRALRRGTIWLCAVAIVLALAVIWYLLA